MIFSSRSYSLYLLKTLLFLLSIWCHIWIVSGQERNIYFNPLIATQPELTVPQGAVANLSHASLPITYSAEEKCTVYVKQNDVITRKFGQLTKTMFSCENIRSVQFHHFGAEFPRKANIKLRIQYENRAGRKVYPTTLLVTVSTPKLYLAYPSADLKSDPTILAVNSLNAISQTLSMRHISIVDRPA